MGKPDLFGYRRPLVFGGSFDPPHVAHVSLPRHVAKAIGADVVLYVPAGRAPHKLDVEQTDPRHRLAMLRLALADESRALVLDDEVERVADGRPSYTVDTLEALVPRLHPAAKMCLLIGMDQVGIFESWYRWERVVELAEPAVMRRPTLEVSSPPPEELSPEWERRVVDVPQTAVSSTEVRRRVAAGESIDALVHPAVAAYIHEHGLYRD